MELYIKTHDSESRGEEEVGDERVCYLQVAPL